jgi:hypothetical protein
VISQERGKDREVSATSGTYPWSFVISRKCALTRGVASLEKNSLVVFYYFSASEIRNVKRGVLTRGDC